MNQTTVLVTEGDDEIREFLCDAVLRPIGYRVLMASDGRERRALRSAMKDHDLCLDVYAKDVRYEQVGRITLQDRGFLWQHETAEQVSEQRMTWAQLSEYLETVAPKKQSDLFFRKHLSREQALEAGKGVVSQIEEVFGALLPAYDVIVGA